MNGRLYDPRLGRFLAPDNYVQDPFGTQNFNRYGYALNNPMVYVDPDGEFIHIIIGAAIGGVVNLVSKAIQGKIHNFGDGLAAFGIGAAGGAVVALTGGAALAATGLTASSIAGGAITGVVGFSTGGMVQNVGNHLYFGDPIMSGKEFATGLGISAVTGGILGGVSHQIWGKGTSIWTGRALNPRISVGELTLDGVVDTKGNIVSSKPDILPDPIKANYAGEGGNKLIPQFSSSTIDDAVKLVANDANKLNHLFPAKHNLGSLVNKFGGQENTVRAILNAANGKLPVSGIFNNIPVNIGGVTVFIRGNVINGVPRLGTMFIP